MSTLPMPPAQPLTYTIAGCSEHSGKYVPENIREDNPLDQSSRWSGAYQAANAKQWMLLKLDTLCVLKTITFGKFHRPHPCNMKEFKLYVGLSEDNMTEILHDGLKNDHISETFVIKHVNHAGVAFPTRFIKIVPLSAHGQSFHTSVWYVGMSGITEESYVEEVRLKHEEYQESFILRHVLKHLRQRRLLTPFYEILTRTSLPPLASSSSSSFEHPLITSLYNSLVLNGSFSDCESLLNTIASEGLFSTSLLAFQPYAQWTRIPDTLDEDGDSKGPTKRSGHAMCIDQSSGNIYMFGGWDGQKSLDDFWVYNIQHHKWRRIDSTRDSPGPRSCHKMVFDDTTGYIYLLGRLDEKASMFEGPSSPNPGDRGSLPPSPPVDRPLGSPHTLPSTWGSTSSVFNSEFHRYHTSGPNAGKWELISADTAGQAGPQLVFDQQMAIDSQAQKIYVSGGRILDNDWDMVKYAGLYSYDIQTGLWKIFHSSDPSSTHPCIPSRSGHSMVLDSQRQTLFIFSGQRDDKYLADMYAFHIPTGSVVELFSNFSAGGGPEAGFTQRAVIDTDLKEIYVFCGLTKGPPGALSVLENDSPYWIYRYDRPDRAGTWTKILPNSTTSPSTSSTSSRSEPSPQEGTPLPRYAHQVVYDTGSKTIYMHGGNAGLGEHFTEDEGFGHGRGHGGVERERDRDRDEDGREREVDEGLRSRRRTSVGEAAGRSRGIGEGEVTDVGEADRENRLDDFWSMRLKRPVADDIIRRGKYLIRQQQFREMCEDTTPVKALSYLQTEVSSVVDHSNPEEAKVFRSLLSHLLTPPKVIPGTSRHPSPPSTETQPPTRKRSRPEGSDGQITEDEDMADAVHSKVAKSSTGTSASSTSTAHRPVISAEPDPAEAKSNESAKPPSPARYKQRMGVFERLLKFVNEDAKQPDKDLVGLINVDADMADGQ